ncbi:hypothetical protein VDQ94_10135 [Xanthomonas campestris pv. campestris]|nr:hypothetical protein [Xanthomonas campestris pv. campestris]MEB1553931.1 hypothetical protein [Xanthomonas campestris pv. campestris]
MNPRADKRLRTFLAPLTARKKIIRALVIEMVDTSLFHLLDMIEHSDDALNVTLKGYNLYDASDGLAGELLTEDGWISRFSNLK